MIRRIWIAVIRRIVLIFNKRYLIRNVKFTQRRCICTERCRRSEENDNEVIRTAKEMDLKLIQNKTKYIKLVNKREKTYG